MGLTEGDETVGRTRYVSARRGVVLLGGLATGKLLLHFLCNGRYGYWIDELYFIACGEHLAWGYVDHPPLIAIVAKGARWLLGDSLFAIRFFPAVAGAALVFLTGQMTRALGGGRFAQALAAVAVIAAPVYLAFHGLLTMNAFEPLFWMLCAYLLIVMVTREAPKLWLLFGMIVGIGFLNKHSMTFFAVSLIAGLLATPERRVLRSRWVFPAALVAFLIALPNLLWEWNRGWPTVELLRNAKLYQHESVSPVEFVWGQIQLTHPFAAPLWLAGLCFYLLAHNGRRYRFLGWTFVLLFAAGILSEAKSYYLSPAYPMLFAAGALMLEQFIQSWDWRWLRPATLTFVVLGGACIAPYVLPVLPPETLVKYLRVMTLREVRPERRAVGALPQLFADMFGWPEKVAAVGRVYATLSPQERDRCAIWGSDYGEAAAVDFFGGPYHLPRAISGHQNYYLWGPGDYSGELMLTINIPAEALRPWFRSVELAATVECQYCMPDRVRVPIYLCRGLKVPLPELWPKVKCWTCDRPAFAAQGAG